MGTGARATAFVTDPVGFIGTELVKFLVAHGHQVFALTGSIDAAESVRHAGATAVMGDLLTPGRWQDEAAADWVFHLSPQSIDRVSGLRRRGASMARALMLMDSNLLEAVAAGATRRIVYVANMSCYGAAGARPITEDEPPRPSDSGREHGENGGRYFLVNSEPARFNEFADNFARIANRPLSVWRLPAAAIRLVIGSRLAGGLQSDAVLSNIRLRGTGFRFEYSTLEQGLRQVLGALYEKT